MIFDITIRLRILLFIILMIISVKFKLQITNSKRELILNKIKFDH